MKRKMTVAVALLTALGASAAKAYPEPITVTQANGQQITIVLHGDEHCSWVTTPDGTMLTLENGLYRVATDDERQAVGRAMMAPRHEPVQTGATMFPHVGSPRALVLLADFQNRKFLHDDAVTREIFDAYLNQEEGKPTHAADATLSYNEGSVRKYFTDMSGGLFTPQFDVAMPVHLSGNLVDYGAGNSDNMAKFIPEVCRLADEAGVDFSQYDANGDGNVDLVYVIYAGWGQSTGGATETIWPKSGTVSGGTYDGKRVLRYGVHSELCMNESAWATPRINGIGLFCHEFSHCMGLPDFYPTATEAQDARNPSMEYFDVMDYGEYVQNGYVPVAYTAWEREAMGWLQIDTLTESRQVELRSLDATEQPGQAYRIMNPEDATGHEYLIVQNLQHEGWNRRLCQAVGAHGMLVTHVDYSASAFTLSSNSVNNTIGHPRMTFLPACGGYYSGFDVSTTEEQAAYFAFHAASVFPGSNSVAALESIPWYTGESDVQQLQNIQETDDGTVSFYYQNNGFSPVTFVTANSGCDADAALYDLQGRSVRWGNVRTGLYVRNGRKWIVK